MLLSQVRCCAIGRSRTCITLPSTRRGRGLLTEFLSSAPEWVGQFQAPSFCRLTWCASAPIWLPRLLGRRSSNLPLLTPAKSMLGQLLSEWSSLKPQLPSLDGSTAGDWEVRHRRKDHSTFDQVLQLPHIARPWVGAQCRHSFFRNMFNTLADLAAIEVDEMSNQLGYIFPRARKGGSSTGNTFSR